MKYYLIYLYAGKVVAIDTFEDEFSRHLTFVDQSNSLQEARGGFRERMLTGVVYNEVQEHDEV